VLKPLLLAAGGVAFATVSAVVQAAGPGPDPSTPSAPARPRADSPMVVEPPSRVDPALAQPAPPVKDSGMVERPPAAGGGDLPRTLPARPSRKDDCRGSAEDCKQNSPR
jgi:hypothetical protein